MKILKLKLYQETACYKKPFATKVAETYPLPPYSTIIGMFHKILQAGPGEYFPMNISVQGSYEGIFSNYQNLRMYKGKDNVTSMPRNVHQLLDVNLIGPFTLSREVGKNMLEHKSGVIINVSSTNAIDTYYEYGLDYDASKAALISLTHNLSKHFAPYVRVNAVAPGWVNTDMNKNLDEDYIKEEEKNIYLKRFAEAKEIAKVIYFLASDDASYITNEVIRVDGGYNHG